jgi:hypothetical protein
MARAMSLASLLSEIDNWLCTAVVFDPELHQQVDQHHFTGAILDGIGSSSARPQVSRPFIYHEISGYQLSYYHQSNYLPLNHHPLVQAPSKANSDLAAQTLGYLSRALRPDTGQPALISHGIWLDPVESSPQAYLFDNGMILQGLCDHWQDDRQATTLQDIISLATLMLDCQRQNGAFPACTEVSIDSASFSADEGCLHVKLAIGLLKTAAITQDQRFEQAAIRLLDWGLSLQREDGAFRCNHRTQQVNGHAMCYALEGYLYAHHRLADSNYLSVAERGCEWLLAHSDSNGMMTRFNNLQLRGTKRWSALLQPMLQWRYWDETIQSARLFHCLADLTANDRYLVGRDRVVGQLERQAGPLINCISQLQANPLHKTFTWPNQFASQLLRFVLDDWPAEQAVEYLF